jgi:hypothetical protein
VSESNTTYNSSTGTISMTFSYNTSLNDMPLSVSFVPPAIPQYFFMPTVKTAVPSTTTNNLALKVYSPSQYSTVAYINMSVWAIAISALIVFLAGFALVSKLMGLEMMLIFQVAYCGLLMMQKL